MANKCLDRLWDEKDDQSLSFAVVLARSESDHEETDLEL